MGSKKSKPQTTTSKTITSPEQKQAIAQGVKSFREIFGPIQKELGAQFLDFLRNPEKAADIVGRLVAPQLAAIGQQTQQLSENILRDLGQRNLLQNFGGVSAQLLARPQQLKTQLSSQAIGAAGLQLRNQAIQFGQSGQGQGQLALRLPTGSSVTGPGGRPGLSPVAAGLSGGLSGAAAGAKVGTALGGPGVGTAIGAGLGLAAGLFG